MRFVSAALGVALLLLLPAASEAGLYSRAWMSDTTIVADAGADSINFQPWDADGAFRADSWAAKLMAVDDTSTVLLKYYHVGNEASGDYTTIKLSAGQTKGLPARADSFKVYLSANHQTMQFEIVAVAGSEILPLVGMERTDITGLEEAKVDSAMTYLAASFSWLDSTFAVHFEEYVRRAIVEGDTSTTFFNQHFRDLFYAYDATLRAMRVAFTDSNRVDLTDFDEVKADSALGAIKEGYDPDLLAHRVAFTDSNRVDLTDFNEAKADTACRRILGAYQVVDEAVDAGADSSFAVDNRPHPSGRATDTTFVAASRKWFPLYDREWNTIRAEIVDVWAVDCVDTVLAYGPYSEFFVILRATGGYMAMRWERCMIDSVRHSPDGAGHVGHSGQGVVR